MSAHARSTDPWTSWEAGRRVQISEGQGLVLETFARFGPMTDEQLVSRVNLSPSGARTRRAELVALGLIEDTGRVSVGQTGRRMIVWGPRFPIITETEQRALWGDR